MAKRLFPQKSSNNNNSSSEDAVQQHRQSVMMMMMMMDPAAYLMPGHIPFRKWLCGPGTVKDALGLCRRRRTNAVVVDASPVLGADESGPPRVS